MPFVYLPVAHTGVAVGDGAGGLVAVGAGGGGVSGTTLRVGSGNGGVRRLLLLLVFEFVFSFAGAGLKSSSGSTEGSTLATGLGLAITGGAILPPEGIPCSLLPVGDAPGCTG